jgi:hypothetical protein
MRPWPPESAVLYARSDVSDTSGRAFVLTMFSRRCRLDTHPTVVAAVLTRPERDSARRRRFASARAVGRGGRVISRLDACCQATQSGDLDCVAAVDIEAARCARRYRAASIAARPRASSTISAKRQNYPRAASGDCQKPLVRSATALDWDPVVFVFPATLKSC